MNVKNLQPGEVLYFVPEELAMVVVMTNEEGIRYIEPNRMEFDDYGNVKSHYASYDTISEWTISLGTINNISAKLTGK